MKRLVLTLALFAGLSLSARLASSAPLFFEDFKDNGPNVAPGYITYNWDDPNQNTVITESRNGELIEFDTTANGWWFTSYSFEYPTTGTLTWDTDQHQYLQAYFPWKGDSDLIALQAYIDGGAITGDMWVNRIDNAEQWYHSQPTLVNVNSYFALSPGVHQIRFRFYFITTQYQTNPPNQDYVSASWDWVKGGMPPSADVTIGTYKDGGGNATSVVCGFSGPPDTLPTGTNRPVLEWTAPAGYSNLSYIVTYSQDPQFRGDTTVTVHGVTDTSLKIGPLAMGTWYWTVIPVNSDDIAGQDMMKTITAYWNQPEFYVYYSFEVDTDVPAELTEFVVE